MRAADSAVAEATAQLSRFVATTDFRDLPAAVAERAALITADMLGVALRGSLEPEMERLCARLPAGRGATMLRTGLPQASPATAAFANATATCFLELDEGIRPTGHPAVHVVPPALALAESLGSSGREYLAAVVLGYEVMARISRACRLGWSVHPHGNMGHAAAVAALGKLSGWDADRIRHGINSATALAMATSWQPCMAGATVRNAYPGLTAQTAFAVRTLVESGFTGYEGALGETFGEILGEDFDPAALSAGLGDRYAVLDDYFKFHAACALNHPVLDALADALGAMRRDGEYPPLPAPSRPAPEEIRWVKVRVAERFTRLAARAEPNQLSAKFSIPFAAAVYLVRGTTDPDSFRGDALTDRRVRQLEARVEVIGDASLTSRWPAEAASEVEVALEDGRVLRGACSNPFGTAANPPAASDLFAKFRHLAAGVLSDAQQEAVWSTSTSLASLDSMSRFLIHLSTER